MSSPRALVTAAGFLGLGLAALAPVPGGSRAAGEIVVAPPAGPLSRASYTRPLFGPEILRAEPRTGSLVVASLRIGEAVEVLAPSGPGIEADGVAAPWVEVRAGGKAGHLRSGMLATFSAVADLDGDGRTELFLVRNRTWSVYAEARPKHPSRLGVRVARDGALIAETELGPGPEGEEEWKLERVEVRRPAGLTPAATFVALAFEFVGVTGGRGEQLFVLAGGMLRPVLRINYYEGEGGWCERKATFPADAGGEPNRILVKVICYDAGDADPPVSATTLERWRWTGTTFVSEPDPGKRRTKKK